MLSTNERKRLDQAQHNENAFKFLESSELYNDWAVTAIFYSSLHYIRYKFFPITIDSGRTYVTLDEYVSENKRESEHRRNAHSITKDFLRSQCSSIATDYKDLYGICHAARYTDYNVSKEELEIAKTHFEVIKKFCNTDKQNSTIPAKRKRKRVPFRGK